MAFRAQPRFTRIRCRGNCRRAGTHAAKARRHAEMPSAPGLRPRPDTLDGSAGIRHTSLAPFELPISTCRERRSSAWISTVTTDVGLHRFSVPRASAERTTRRICLGNSNDARNDHPARCARRGGYVGRDTRSGERTIAAYRRSKTRDGRPRMGLTPDHAGGHGSAAAGEFARTLELASQCARMAVKGFGDAPYTLVSTSIPTRLLRTAADATATVDRGVASVRLPGRLLKSLSPAEVLPAMPIP